MPWNERDLQPRLDLIAQKIDALKDLHSQRLATVEEALTRGRERFKDQEDRLRKLEADVFAERGRASLRRWAWGILLTVIALVIAAVKLLL